VDRVEQLVVALEAASPEARSGIAAAARRAGIRAIRGTGGRFGHSDAEFTLRYASDWDGRGLKQPEKRRRMHFRFRSGNGANHTHPPICRAVRLNLRDGTVASDPRR